MARNSPECAAQPRRMEAKRVIGSKAIDVDVEWKMWDKLHLPLKMDGRLMSSSQMAMGLQIDEHCVCHNTSTDNETY